MKIRAAASILAVSTYLSVCGQAEVPIRVTPLDASQLNGREQWESAGSVWFDPSNKKKVVREKGESIWVSEAPQGAPLEATLGEGHSLYIELDYMLAVGGSLQLRWQEDRGLLFVEREGSMASTNGTLVGSPLFPPRVGTGRAPGLWQHARLWISADGWVKGVMINGVVVHRMVRTGQQAVGAPWNLTLAPQGGVAVRNIRYAVMDTADAETLTPSFDFATQREVIVTPHEHPVVQRCFIQDGLVKKTYCVAVGEPQGMHYVIDQAQATLLGVWRGEFYDASTMWISRGEPQVAQPLGSVVWFDGKPLMATLASAASVWPDSAQHGLRINGYELDQERRPTFTYTFNGMSVVDKVRPSDDFRGFERTLSITQVSEPDTWLRLASGTEIREVGKRMYAIDDKVYYLQLPHTKGIEASVRNVNGTAELLVAVKGDMELTYSILW